jgi:hypothetical protein
MADSSELKVSSAILKDAGISDRKVAYRAIKSLEKAGELTADRHSGRRTVIKLITHPSTKLDMISATWEMVLSEIGGIIGWCPAQ